MKKRVLSIILALVMVLPLVLASCDTKSEADKMKEIILGTEGDETERAYTLSLWIPTNKITVEGKTADLSELTQKEKKALEKDYPDVYEFLLRVDAVEDAINQILVSRNYYTHIDIVPVYDEYYEKAIQERFSAMSANSKPGEMNQRGDSDEYKNDVVEEVVGDSTLYKLLYRPVDNNQLDIFLIRSYDDYVSYINSNYLLPLNDVNAQGNASTSTNTETSTDTNATDTNKSIIPATNYITSLGSYYSIYKLIRKEFLDQMQYGEKNLIYALPNNHLYAEDYQYILLNKDLLDAYEGEIDLENAESYDKMLEQIKAFVEYSATQTDEDGKEYSGLLAGITDAPSYLYSNDNLQLGGTVDSTTLNYAYFDTNFANYVKLYKELAESGLIADTNAENSAVQIINATSEEIKAYEESYQVYVSRNPVAKNEDIYSSMFAISTFSVDFDRSMKILYLLQSDTQIRTLLQYGIKDEDYVIKTVKDGNGKEVEKISLKDTAYKNAFEVKYTGNSYYTYPGDNTQLSDWDYEKSTNLAAFVGQYFGYNNYVLKLAQTSEEEKAILSKIDDIEKIVVQTQQQIEQMTYSEYVAFLEVLSEDILAKYARLEEIQQKDIPTYQQSYDENMGYIAQNQPILDEKLPHKEEYQAKIEELEKEEDFYDFEKRIRKLQNSISENEEIIGKLEDSTDPEEIKMLEELEKEVEKQKAELQQVEALKEQMSEEELKETTDRIKSELETYNGLLKEITTLEDNINAWQSRADDAQKEIDKLNEELNVTIPNQLKEWEEKSSAAFELKSTEDFVSFMSIYKKYYDILVSEKNK